MSFFLPFLLAHHLPNVHSSVCKLHCRHRQNGWTEWTGNLLHSWMRKKLPRSWLKGAALKSRPPKRRGWSGTKALSSTRKETTPRMWVNLTYLLRYITADVVRKSMPPSPIAIACNISIVMTNIFLLAVYVCTTRMRHAVLCTIASKFNDDVRCP